MHWLRAWSNGVHVHLDRTASLTASPHRSAPRRLALLLCLSRHDQHMSSMPHQPYRRTACLQQFLELSSSEVRPGFRIFLKRRPLRVCPVQSISKKFQVFWNIGCMHLMKIAQWQYCVLVRFSRQKTGFILAKTTVWVLWTSHLLGPKNPINSTKIWAEKTYCAGFEGRLCFTCRIIPISKCLLTMVILSRLRIGLFLFQTAFLWLK